MVRDHDPCGRRPGGGPLQVHYHFGALADLRLAIARQATDEVIGPVIAGFLAAADEREALDAMRRLLPETTADLRVARLAAELMTEGSRDPALGEMSRHGLRAAREHIVVRLGRLRPDWSPTRRTGAAILIAAMLDGLMLHCLLDLELEVDAGLTALADLMRVRG